MKTPPEFIPEFGPEHSGAISLEAASEPGDPASYLYRGYVYTFGTRDTLRGPFIDYQTGFWRRGRPSGYQEDPRALHVTPGLVALILGLLAMFPVVFCIHRFPVKIQGPLCFICPALVVVLASVIIIKVHPGEGES